jgi:putative PIN family toxin of toxin-antitoxin system
MPRKTVKVIIDTNIWISFLISNSYTKLEKILFSNKVELLRSDQLLNEFLRVAKRPKFLKYFSDDDIQIVLTILHENTTNIEVRTLENICRDPKDNFLLSLAMDGKADYLLTGDEDLLTLKIYKKTKIITIAQFLEIL